MQDWVRLNSLFQASFCEWQSQKSDGEETRALQPFCQAPTTGKAWPAGTQSEEHTTLFSRGSHTASAPSRTREALNKYMGRFNGIIRLKQLNCCLECSRNKTGEESRPGALGRGLLRRHTWGSPDSISKITEHWSFAPKITLLFSLEFSPY